MKKKDIVQWVITELDKLYPNPPIPLNHKDAFTLLVAVVLSAQSTDKKVNEITPKLFSIADTPNKMAVLSVDTIKELIKEIGLTNNKAKALKGLSEKIITNHNGQVPQTFEELEALPGVGHKTASVVMSQAFGVQTFPVDTHIHRLMHRWTLSNGKSVEQTELDAKKIFPKNKWNVLHLQIIYYGREYSPAKGWNKEKDYITRYILEN